MRVALAHMYTFRILRGIERNVINLANALVRLGTDVVVVTGRTASPRSADPLDPRVSVHMVPHYHWHKVTFVPGFFADFLRHRYDALVLNLARGEGWAAAAADRVRRLPYTAVFQYPAPGHEKQYRNWKRIGVSRRAKHLIAASRYVAQDVERWFGRPAVVIPNGVSPEKFRFDPAVRGAVRAELGIDDADRVILTVASIEGRKGIRNVLAALPRVLARGSGIRHHYLIVGDGSAEQRAEFERAVRAFGLEATVRLLGFQQAPERYYSAADAFVLLSKDEACPTVVLEALACGLPVVATDGCAFPELVPPGIGRLVQPDEPDEVADALGAVLAEGRPGDAARAPTVGRFSWDAIAAQYAATLRGG